MKISIPFRNDSVLRICCCWCFLYSVRFLLLLFVSSSSCFVFLCSVILLSECYKYPYIWWNISAIRSLVYVCTQISYCICNIILCNINTLNQLLFGYSLASDRFHRNEHTHTHDTHLSQMDSVIEMDVQILSAHKCIFCFTLTEWCGTRYQREIGYYRLILNIRFPKIYEFDKCWSIFRIHMFLCIVCTFDIECSLHTNNFHLGKVCLGERVNTNTLCHRNSMRKSGLDFGSVNSDKCISQSLLCFMTSSTLYLYDIEGFLFLISVAFFFFALFCRLDPHHMQTSSWYLRVFFVMHFITFASTIFVSPVNQFQILLRSVVVVVVVLTFFSLSVSMG